MNKAKLGIFSSSYPANQLYPKRFRRACQVLRSDFDLVIGELSGANHKPKNAYLSGDAKARAEELNQLARLCDYLMPSLGGYNSNAILDKIDYECFRQYRPILIGFSDTTAINLALYAKNQQPSLIGQSLIANYGGFDREPEWHLWLLRRALTLEQTLVAPPKLWTDDWQNWEDYDSPKSYHTNHWFFQGRGWIKGTMIGGNMDTLCQLLGTPYMPEINEETILFIEETSLSWDQIERNLHTLRLAGLFDKIQGLMVGKFEQIKSMGESQTLNEVIDELTKTRQIPVLSNIDCGHTQPSLLLPLGGEVMIDFDRKTLIVDYSQLRSYKGA